MTSLSSSRRHLTRTTRWPPPARHSEVRRGDGGRQDGDGGLGATVAQRPILLTVRGAGGRRGASRPRQESVMCAHVTSDE